MPSHIDAINAIMVLKDLADTEQKFLVEFTEEGRSVTNDELRSHLNVVKNLLGSQSALLYIMLNQMIETDDRLNEIVHKLSE